MTHRTQESTVLTEEQPNEEARRIMTGKVPSAELPCPLPTESGHITLLVCEGTRQPGGFTKLQFLEFLLGLHYAGIFN